MKKAYSYQRFSSIKQKEGDSLKRQNEAALGFCKQFQLLLVDTFKDEGKSAFKGRNFTNESALGSFLRLVETGKIENGSVLIIENMDRLSRQSILPCLSKFIEIINSGIGIGVVTQNKIFDVQSITNNPMELMFVLVEFARAGSESQIKSERLKSVVRAKIERAQKGEKVWFGVMKPTWVTGVKNGQFILDEERGKLVKEIFTRYMAGHSCTRIANDMNGSHTPTLRNIKGGMWTNSIVREILKNKNVVGWFGINNVEIENYFPQIISDKVFQLIQTKLAFNVKSRGGSKYGMIRNLFKGLLFCSECGQQIETKIGSYKRVDGTMSHYADYICRGVKYGNDCKNKGRVSVKDFETKIISSIVRVDDFISAPLIMSGNNILDELETKLSKVQTSIDRCMTMLDDETLSDMKEITTKLSNLKSERGVIQKQIDTEKSKTVTVDEGNKSLQDMVDNLFPSKKSMTVDPEQMKADIKAAAQYVVEKVNRGKPKRVDLIKNLVRTEIQKRLSDKKQRETTRNMLPSIFQKVTIKFGEFAKAQCVFVDGKTVTVEIK
jgi:Resolvase, N terminal domain/Recombinase/Recombinase zinc beta ribbon domain